MIDKGGSGMGKLPPYPPRPAREIALFRKLMRHCLRTANAHSRAGDLDLALGWARWAALLFCDQRCGVLVNSELEQTLARLARRLPRPQPATPRRSGPRRWLHVFTHWEPTGGHSALALRWFQADTSGDAHSIVLMEQTAALPDNVEAITQTTGGRVYIIEPDLPPSRRAARLRTLAWEQFDVVSLHLHQFDAVSAAAFGTPGGPPVVFINGADHMFWVGAGVADLVLHIRPLAEEWGRLYRGLQNARVLPIPLPEPPPITAAERAAARQELGLEPETCTLLCIGSEWKFAPLPGLDFTAIAEEVLQACPSAQLLVVGPNPQETRWRTAQERCGGRLRVFAAQPQLQRFHRAADLYLDSLPHGSLTALLEVAALGVPCVLQPRSCPYPLYPEDGALAVLDRPADVADYVRRVQSLVANAEARRQQGEKLARSVRAHHCGDGWRDHLAAALAALPRCHRIHRIAPPSPLPDSYVRFWHQFLGPLPIEGILHHVMEHPVRAGLGLRRDGLLWKTILKESLALSPESGTNLVERYFALTAPKPEMGLYVDCGEGFSEKRRVNVKTEWGERDFCVTFDLSGYRTIRALRWDPVEECFCKVWLESITYRDAAGQTLSLDLEGIATNGLRLPDGAYLFNTTDPMFFLPIEGKIATLTIRGRWRVPLPDREMELESRLEQSRREHQLRFEMREEQLKAILASRRWRLASKLSSLSRILPGRRAS